MKPSNLQLTAACLAIFSALLILPFIGVSHVFQVAEAREGVVVNEILSGGGVILPLRNGEIVPSKPPLFHWFGAAGAKLFREYQEFELRFPSAIAAIGCLLTVFFLAASLADLPAGLLSAAILLSTYGFVRVAGDGRVDMLFCFFCTTIISLWLFKLADASKEFKPSAIPAKFYAILGPLAGLAVLAKGPLGIVFPLLVIGAVAYYYERADGLRSLLRREWLLSFAVFGPWYLLAALLGDRAFLARQLFFENVNRFVGGEGITQKPVWFYFAHIWTQGAPWTFVLLYVFFVILRSRFMQDDEWRRGLTDKSRLAVVSGLIWFVTGLCFLSLSSGKRRAYLLLVLPAVAVIISAFVSGRFREQLRTSATFPLSDEHAERLKRWGVGAVSASVIFLFVAFLVSRFELLSPILNERTAITLSAVADAMLLSPWLLLFYLAALSAMTLMCWLKGMNERRTLFAAAAVFLYMQLILVVFLNIGLAIKGITHSYRNFALAVAKTVPENDKINFVKTRLDESFDGFFFYFRRHVKMIDPQETPSAAGVYLARRHWVNALTPQIQVRKEEIFEGGRLADEPEERLVLFRLSDPTGTQPSS